jgi:sulfur relay protein TusB/DsrH
MIVLVKSYPETEDSRAALSLAENMKAVVVFLQNGVYHMTRDTLSGFSCKSYFIDDDLRMRGLATADNAIGYHELVDMIGDADKVIGLL